MESSGGNTEKVVALGLTLEQVALFSSESQRHKNQLLIILLPEELLPMARALPELLDRQQSGKVRICCYSDYLDEIDEDDFYVDLPHRCLKDSSEFLSFITSSVSCSHKDIPLVPLIQHHFLSNQIWPLYQLVFQFEHILKVEQPNEVWVCRGRDWQYTICEPRWVPLGKYVDYCAVEVESLIRVASLHGVRLRYLPPSLSDRGRYVFTRMLRPSIIKVYRQIQLARSRIRPISNNHRELDQGTYPLAIALVRSPIHSIRLHPILHELSQLSWNTCIVDDYSLAVRQTNTTHTKERSISLASWQGINLYRHQLVARQIKRWIQHNHNKMTEVSYRGVVVTDIFCHTLQQLADKLSEATSLLDAFNKILDTHVPSVVLVANDQDVSSRCLVSICRQRGIPTVTVQHGLMALPPLDFVPVFTDAIALMGPMAKDILIKFNTSPRKISVSGIPGFDFGAETLQRRTSSATDSITLITQKWPAFFHNVFPRYLQLAREMPEENFLIKVAPQESISKYRNSVPNVTISAGQSLEEVLKTSKLVLGFNSTALLEAMQMGIPTVIVDTFFEHKNPMAEGATCIKLDSDWAPIIREVLQNENMRAEMIEHQNKFLNYMLRREPGAAKRIATWIHDMVNLDAR